MDDNWKRFVDRYYGGVDPCRIPPEPVPHFANLFRGCNKLRRQYYFVRRILRRCWRWIPRKDKEG